MLQPSSESAGAGIPSGSSPASVSVVVPVYNGQKYIAETLRTILAQTAPPKEIIVIDDGSTDDSAAVVRAFGDAVQLTTVQNGGAAKARNIGGSLATGDWIAFCDSDDLWLPTKLEKQLKLAQECPEVHCVLTDYAEITDGIVSDRSHFSYAPDGFWNPEWHNSGFVIRDSITGKLPIFQPGITSTPIVKREFFLSSGGFDPNAENSAEDTCFHFRCLSVLPFAVVPEVLMHYRRHSESWSADASKQLKNSVVMWEYIIRTYPGAQPHRQELERSLSVLRQEVSEMERYRRRQKIKKFLRLGR